MRLDAHHERLEVEAAFLGALDERVERLVELLLDRLRRGGFRVRLLLGGLLAGHLERDLAVFEFLENFLVVEEVLHAAELRLRRFVGATAGLHDAGDDLGAADFVLLHEPAEIDIIGLRGFERLVELREQLDEFLIRLRLGLRLDAGFRGLFVFRTFADAGSGGRGGFLNWCFWGGCRHILI